MTWGLPCTRYTLVIFRYLVLDIDLSIVLVKNSIVKYFTFLGIASHNVNESFNNLLCSNGQTKFREIVHLVFTTKIAQLYKKNERKF